MNIHLSQNMNQGDVCRIPQSSILLECDACLLNAWHLRKPVTESYITGLQKGNNKTLGDLSIDAFVLVVYIIELKSSVSHCYLQ